jgi:thiol-disulfide isomerase/thioredoxin
MKLLATATLITVTLTTVTLTTVTLISLLLSTTVFSQDAFAQDNSQLKGIRVYDIGEAPNFKLNDIDGEPFELKQTRGKWIFLHFWASWCGPCKIEMPTIEKLINEIKSDKFKVVMVNTAEDDDTIFTFLGEIGIESTSLMDSDGEITDKYKPRGLPTTFLIDPTGRIRYQAIGGREWDKKEYIEFIKALING